MPTIDIEDPILQIVQKCFAMRPVIVLGSGASCKYDIPGMGRLAKHLMNMIPKDPAYEIELQQFNALLSAGTDLENALLIVRPAKELEDQIVRFTHEYILEADLKHYHNYTTGLVSNPLSELLIHLDRTANPTTKIITTNYDRIAEYAIESAELDYFTGFSGRYLGQYRGFSQCSGLREPIELLKVHGSLDWFIDERGSAFSFPNQDYEKQKYLPLIVTPGIKKYEYTHNDPFRGIIARSDYAFDSARSIVCFGYGFNDTHIQPRLVKRIQKEKIPVLVLALKLTENARRFINSSTNREVIGIEASSKGSILRFANDISVESSMPLWELEEILKIAI